MSSSRIIKSSSESGHGEYFFLEEFGEEEPADAYISDDDTFQPLFAEFITRPIIEPPPPTIDMEALLSGMISEEEAQQRIDDAYDNGFAESRRQLEDDLIVVSRAFGSAVAEIGSLRELLLKESEDDLLRLAIKLAERIIRQEITLDRTILVRTVTQVVEEMADTDGVIVRFNPVDYEIIAGSGSLLHAALPDMTRIDVKADATISLGGCIVETTTGQVDGRIEAQLTELFNQLMEERVSHSGESEDEQEEALLS